MAFRKFIEGHIAVLPGENFDPKEGRNGVFFDSKVLEETLETKNVPQGIRIQKIKVPKEAILREDKTRFAYKANQKVKLLSGRARSIDEKDRRVSLRPFLFI